MNTYETIKNNNGFVDIASNLVSYSEKYKNIILNQLGNIIIVDNMDSAIIIGRLINHRYRIVTLDGEIIHVGGSLTGGSNKKSNSVILDKMELEKIINENQKINSSISLLNSNINNNNDSINKLNVKIDGLKRKSIYFDELLNVKNNELKNNI